MICGFRPTFRRIWKSRSVEQFPVAPYLATLMNCLLWVLYGLPLVHPHSMLVITINGCGLLIELSYVVIYLCFSSRRQALQVLGMLFLEIAFVAVIAVLVLTLFHTHEQRSLVVGVLCVIFGTVMYAAPLSVMVCMDHASLILIKTKQKTEHNLLFFVFCFLFAISFSLPELHQTQQ